MGCALSEQETSCAGGSSCGLEKDTEVDPHYYEHDGNDTSRSNKAGSGTSRSNKSSAGDGKAASGYDDSLPDCCTAFPEGYKDITPAEGPDGPDYLKGCKLVHMHLKKGAKEVPHYHPKHYMYIIKGGKLKIIGAPAPAGEEMEAEMPTGVGLVMPAGDHVVKNVGEDDVEVLLIEVGDHNGTTPEEHLPCFEAEPDHYKVVAEDEDWMVVAMTMQPGEEDKPHSHREHIVYILSEGELSIWGGKEKTDPEKADLVAPVVPGAVLPVPTGFHIVKNTGETPVTAVFFERKK